MFSQVPTFINFLHRKAIVSFRLHSSIKCYIGKSSIIYYSFEHNIIVELCGIVVLVCSGNSIHHQGFQAKIARREMSKLILIIRSTSFMFYLYIVGSDYFLRLRLQIFFLFSEIFFILRNIFFLFSEIVMEISAANFDLL